MQQEALIAIFVYLILTISRCVVILGIMYAIDNTLRIINNRTLSRKMEHVRFTGTCLSLRDPEGLLIRLQPQTTTHGSNDPTNATKHRGLCMVRNSPVNAKCARVCDISIWMLIKPSSSPSFSLEYKHRQWVADFNQWLQCQYIECMWMCVCMRFLWHRHKWINPRQPWGGIVCIWCAKWWVSAPACDSYY